MENILEKHNQTLRQWKRFVSGLPVDNTIISETILDSWERASKLELDPYTKKITHVLNDTELAELIDKNEELITTSMPFLDNLNNYVKDSGFFCSLCDSNGYILKLLGDENTVRNVQRGNFVPGACSSEDTIGPNGIGTAMRLNQPVQVFSCEHYFISFHNYTCNGAPIHNPEGNIIGIINVTGPFLNANPHTLGMVVAAAHAIENLLYLKKAFSECQVAENLQKTVIASIPEALISINTKNKITLINQNAQRLFNLSPDKVIGKDICKVFGEKNKTFLNMIINKKTVTDAEVRIFIDNAGSDYTMTFNAIMSPEKHVLGKVIILNEITRARTLVTKMIGAKANIDYEDIIGCNKNFMETLRLAKIASQSTSNVLLTGESGT
ncbi:MAG: PAS domain-containing protein, partial [Deltaproteobacteria bacterium]|nr:PAS domain-containing protein [Deltaproteobacteria bacterium]